jgi:hypothetical protein
MKREIDNDFARGPEPFVREGWGGLTCEGEGLGYIPIGAPREIVRV